jgi:hypothetical protein
MNTLLIERAIIANRPGEPFVLIERSPSEVEDLSILDWQAPTEPPTWDEASAWATALAAEDARAAATANVEGLLRDSDKWGARHTEDGISMTPERIVYRVALRGVLGELATAADPAAVVIPDPPKPPSA